MIITNNVPATTAKQVGSPCWDMSAVQFLYLSMPMGMVQIFVILQNYRQSKFKT